MSHFSTEDRKKISNMIAQGCKCIEIARVLGKDPTSISKEIKRNRIISKEGKGKEKFLCKKLEKFPYVCVDCKYKYTTCVLTQMKYDAMYADKKAIYKLHNSRRGINMTYEDHKLLNELLTIGLKNKKSLYTIVKESGLDISVPTVYRYISEKKVDVSKMDLPYAVTYKKRKKKIKEYDYPNNRINRSNRTFIDYLAYMHSHINEMTVQMDFLGSIRTDHKSILVLVIPQLQFPLLFLLEDKNSKKVNDIFNNLEKDLGLEDFKKVFPSILTDRDPSFNDINGIEFSPITGEQRTFLFYCDAFKSNQKANVENINKQLRKFFPKKTSIDEFTNEDIKRVNLTMINCKLFSLDARSPKEAFITVFGLEVFNKLFR